ncbi:hypothetical protein M5X00_13185 [Paenibacillus alvei]|uniref:hypothetical protein n=1 Tax=Paenibacillus alvei TaxID=44250 RepID=UPI000289DAA7|nr:hypothetical protein [Paenibacillus alvei]EJW13791.1 hypothetical protein PAV_109p00210 [Paenibacillus alvei DSM 29]MCY9540523.1 hypothetical protein [Paenibacillus alvei]MCY9708273.1 hypothetical protein [Paenibacillus alvei]MCY9732932.1 hypothetical protein [Paenibacillus alvei]MCY9755194.1 hypothetical protein [Paenibacillus alvei]
MTNKQIEEPDLTVYQVNNAVVVSPNKRKAIMQCNASASLSPFEKGFAQYNELLVQVKAYGGERVPGGLRRRFNDAIRMMASEDYARMEKIVASPWTIRVALHNWEPCEDGIAWRRKS